MRMNINVKSQVLLHILAKTEIASQLW